MLLTLVPGLSVLAQTTDAEEPTAQESKIRDRMQEYIQSRLNLSRGEAEKFTPIFVRYFREFAQTHRSFKSDRLVLQQKIIDLRLRYRTEFRQIMDEKRANQVFKHEDDFRKEAIQIIRENRRERMERGGLRRNKALIP